ncbi:MAG: hemolysin family protein [Verrucomicrobiota bacterium]|nr:hemolysin family protein [Limisphaera sp.]MDW8382013.1 hemolysin family protein [Verrucomicrobiota bacterium]
MEATLWCLAVGAAGAAASFFFALAETAVFSLSPWQARRLSETHAVRGHLLAECLRRPEDLLATMVLGNTLANGVLLAAGLSIALMGHWPWTWTVTGVVLVTLLAGEVLPKTLAVRKPGPWSLRVVRPLMWIHRLFRPLHGLAQRINEAFLRGWGASSGVTPAALSEEEYRELVEWAFQQGSLVRGQRDLLVQILGLDRRTVREVMVPRAQMAWIRDDLSIEAMIQEARQRRYRRLPIYDEEADMIVGILNVRAFLMDPRGDLAEVIEVPSFVPESMNLLRLLQSLQRQRRGMAIVLDEFGVVSGLVTLEDILTEVVGGRPRATVRRARWQRLGPGRWQADGGVRLEDFRRECPLVGEIQDVETLAGLMLSLTGVVPARGESVQFRNLRLTATEVDERRIRQLIVEQIKR